MGSVAMIDIPSFSKTGSGIQKLIRGYTHRDTHTDSKMHFIWLLLCLQDKENKLKCVWFFRIIFGIFSPFLLIDSWNGVGMHWANVAKYTSMVRFSLSSGNYFVIIFSLRVSSDKNNLYKIFKALTTFNAVSCVTLVQTFKSLKGEFTDTQTAWWSHKPTLIFFKWRNKLKKWSRATLQMVIMSRIRGLSD
jgi:hypothetical protein